MRYGDAGHALGVHGNTLRYAALTGRLAIRWEGARQPLVWTVPPPTIAQTEATLELARRFLRIFGPAGPEAFGKWAGIGAREAVRAFDQLGGELIQVSTPIGEKSLLAVDEPAIRETRVPAAAARLLPSGDAYTLHGTSDDRALLVPDAAQRAELWTPRVWPGALLVAGEIVGHLAPRAAHDDDPGLAEALARRARRGRCRGRIAAATRPGQRNGRPLDLTAGR